MTSPDVERSLYADRTILSEYDPATEDDREGWADVTYEAIRAMNHITGHGYAIPAPVAYRILGNLTGAANMLPQLCSQLARGLERSLEEYDVYDHNGEPDQSVASAVADLRAAAANDLAAHLGSAQVAINAQGYNDPEEESR